MDWILTESEWRKAVSSPVKEARWTIMALPRRTLVLKVEKGGMIFGIRNPTAVHMKGVHKHLAPWAIRKLEEEYKLLNWLRE